MCVGNHHKFQPSKELKPQASEMPHRAKHHASENRKAIERSLVTGTRGGGRASERVGCDCEEGEVDITTDPLRGSYCVNIAYHQAARPCSKDTCMVFRIIWHLRCLPPPVFVSVFCHRFSSEPKIDTTWKFCEK